MQHCLSCEATFERSDWTCPSCGAKPSLRNGFVAFAPELAASSDGFPVHAHAALERIEAQSFWFRSRNRLIRDLASRYFKGARNVMEIGCGTGFVLGALRQALPDARLTGSEIYTDGLAIARRRWGEGVTLIQADAQRLPFAAEFDLICAFDVLEHIEDDARVLAEMHRALRPGGGLLLAVPQHPFLWSKADEIGHHQRRYRRGELERKCSAAGFEVVTSTSFVTCLLPVMMLQRRLPRRKPTTLGACGVTVPRALDRVLEIGTELDRLLIRAGARLPAGGSRFVAARRR
jgi:SAM-dependent methyltransferase